MSDQIWQSTGVRVRETISDWVVKQADEVVMVDLTPKALLNRLERGVVYPPERARAALENFFREPTLVALRELAMRQTAHAVESRRPQEESDDDVAADATPTAPGDRVLLVIGPEPAAAALIRRGRRVADYLRSDCLAVYVATGGGFDHLTPEDRGNLQRQLAFANGLHIETAILHGDDVAQAVVEFARSKGVSQIFIGRQRESTWRSIVAGGLVQRLVNLARDMQVTIVADRSVRRAV